jgi:hypothetical protein
MESGKTGKYLKYAIGEIALVMVGILLALQVNNWNENRIAKNNEVKLAEQLLNDARADSVFFESRIWFQKTRDTLFNNLLSAYKGISDDSISKLNVNDDPFFFRLAYQSNLINNNPEAYDLINEELVKNKLRAYKAKYDYVVHSIELNNRICEEYGVPLQIKYYSKLKALSNYPTINDFFFALQDQETVAKFELFKFYGINYLIQCQEFLKVNHELIQLLESFLKENK